MTWRRKNDKKALSALTDADIPAPEEAAV